MAQHKEDDHASGTGVAVVPEKKEKLQRPRRWKVLLHNDDFTSMEFVVSILMGIFHKTQPDAVAIMLSVHKRGIGVAGVFTREIAESKVQEVEALARQAEFPLLCTAEPEEDAPGDDGPAGGDRP